MDDLSTSLDHSKWQKMDVSQKKDFKEYQVMRQHKKLDSFTYRYLLQPEGEDPKGVTIQFTAKDKDPLKNVGTVELCLKEDKVVGIDVDGDCFQLVGN